VFVYVCMYCGVLRFVLYCMCMQQLPMQHDSCVCFVQCEAWVCGVACLHNAAYVCESRVLHEYVKVDVVA
jgi:hypothetical protein